LEWVVGEVAAAHSGGRHGGLDGLAQWKAEPFVGAEKEGAVVSIVEMRKPNRASSGHTEIVADLLGLAGFAVGECVERAVLVVPEKTAVIIIGPALGDGSDRAGLSNLGVVAHSIDAKVGYAFCGRPCIGERMQADHLLRTIFAW
jgi:hypothetical protein